MPGMMDTVLNLGLNDRTVEGLAERAAATAASPTTAIAASSRCTATWCWASTTTSSRRRSRSSSRRKGCPLRHRARRRRARRAGQAPTSRSSPRTPASRSRRTRRSSSGVRSAPCSAPGRRRARSPTAGSTASPSDMGTAVNVQAMVFGNMGEDCATGVAFTRNPSTGEKAYLRRVPDQRPGRGRGRRHPHAAAADARHGRRRAARTAQRAGGGAAADLRASWSTVFDRLEAHYRDMQDIEFTVQQRQALRPADPHRQAHGARRRSRSRSTWRARG